MVTPKPQVYNRYNKLNDSINTATDISEYQGDASIGSKVTNISTKLSQPKNYGNKGSGNVGYSPFASKHLNTQITNS